RIDARRPTARSPCSLTLSRPLTGDLPDHSVRDDPTTPSRPKGSLRPHVLVAERTVPVRLIMAHERCGLTALIWRSCGSAGKTGGVTGSCPLCRSLHIS